MVRIIQEVGIRRIEEPNQTTVCAFKNVWEKGKGGNGKLRVLSKVKMKSNFKNQRFSKCKNCGEGELYLSDDGFCCIDCHKEFTGQKNVKETFNNLEELDKITPDF